MTIDEGTYEERRLDYAHRSGDRALERFDYEEAIHQYQSALAALASAAPGDDETRCELLIALARAQNRAGSIAAAQETAIEAAANARRRFARDQLGRAALAFSPLLPWGEMEGVDASEVKLLEEALALWPDEEASPLHVRLRARLASALSLSPDAVARRRELSDHAVAMARRLEDPASLAHALLARHLAIASPKSVEERFGIATEVVQLGEALRDSRIAFEGRFWRFYDQLELGNADALAADLDACSRLADPRDPNQSWHLVSMRATRAIVAGRADEAEALVAELGDLGRRWAPRFVRILGGRISWGVHRQRGGGSPALDAFLQIAAMSSTARPFHGCVLASIHAESGRTSEARREYERFVPHGLEELSLDLEWALALALLAETCHELGDEDGAAALYEALTPYESLCVTTGAGGFFGAVGLHLGVLATMQRRWAEAARHFERALAVHHRMRAVPWIPRTRCEHAAMLLARGEDGDVDRAHALLAEARPEAKSAGMGRLLARIDVLKARPGQAVENPPDEDLKALGKAPWNAVETPPPDGRGGGNVFRQEGEYWTIVYSDTPVRLRDSKGLHYIAHLLANPAREVHVADLVAVVSGPDDGGSGTGIGAKPQGDAGPLLDQRAAVEYRARLADLRAELEEATTIADIGREQRARHEIDLITRELSAAYGLGGRPRKAGDASERMRKAVTNRIRRALERIGTEHPALGRHLANAIRTGFLCAYTPEQEVEWEL